MTVNQHSPWQQATVYCNPAVQNTPLGALPNNISGTVQHFSKPVKLLKFVSPEGYAHCDGVPTRGEPVALDFWCVIKPVSNATSQIQHTKQTERGEYAEGAWLLYYDPFHPNHPGTGIHLQMSDAVNSDYSGFADVIEYQDRQWIVRSLTKLDIDYAPHVERYIGKALIELWAAPSHTASPESVSHVIQHYQLKP